MKPFLDISILGDPIPTRSKDEIRFCCPYCGDEKYHLYLNLHKSVFHCMRCGQSGKTNVTTDRLRSIHLSDPRTNTPVVSSLHKLPHAHPDILPPLALRFLTQRQIYEADVKRHSIFAASPNSKYFSRLILPYSPSAGYARYFVARSYTSIAFPRYLNPPGSKDIVFFSPQDIPSGHPWDLYWDIDELVLVEGPFDMVKASRHGPAGAIMGKELKPSQARIIVAGFTRVYILLDNDTHNTMASVKIKDQLELHLETIILKCPKKDPGEMTPEDFKNLFLERRS